MGSISPGRLTGSGDTRIEFHSRVYKWFDKKGTVEVILEKEVNEESLKWIARQIIDGVFPDAERIFMFYHLKGRAIDDSGCYATTHYLNGEIEWYKNEYY